MFAPETVMDITLKPIALDKKADFYVASVSAFF